jgi:hypothetical protein
MRQLLQDFRHFVSSLHNLVRWEALGALGLAALVAGLLIANPLNPAQWLMGWDNINPELNLPLNITRAFHAVWQEYQGVGLVGGMGHAADLPRLIVFWLLSFVLPLNLLRPLWVIAMLLLGIVGVYVFLLRRVIPSLFPAASLQVRTLGAFAGGVFALINLATLQMFRTPFEPFVTHFGFLPWLLMLTIDLIQAPSRKRVFLFATLTLLAAPQGYVQTVFLVYAMLLGILSVATLLTRPTKVALLRIVGIWAITLAMNAFWLFPFGYFLTSNTKVTVDAKINQMSTDEVYLRNRAFGTIWDTMLLKGFWFDTFDLDTQKNEILPVLSPWRMYAQEPIPSALLASAFGMAVLGALVLLARRRRAWVWLPVAFVALVTMLTLDTPPFAWINDLLSRVPLFHQAYRFRFTKFSLAAGIIYSMLFGIGMTMLTQKLHKHLRVASVLILATLLLFAGVISYPAIRGHFWYEPIKLTLPSEYLSLSSFLATQPVGRIASLPQPTFWGWSYYRWGYTGWGFLWYGVSQPIMDRAFDPWSATNENYFWQLTLALYRKDPQAMEEVLDRYDIRYILLDNNVISPSHARALFTEEIESLLPLLPSFGDKQIFGNLSLYSRINPASNTYISLQNTLPKVFPAYTFSDEDTAFGEVGNYQTAATPNDADFLYPYRSLLTKRSVDAREFTVKETASELTIAPLRDLPGTSSAIINKESSLVFDTRESQVLNNLSVIPCGLLKSGAATGALLDGTLRLTSTNQRGCVSFSLGALPHAQGYLVAVSSRHTEGRPLLFSLINQTAKHTEIETYLPADKEEKITYFVLPPLAQDGLGYGVYLSNDAIGNQTTVNDVSRIAVYTIPYADLLAFRLANTNTPVASETAALQTTGARLISVVHPNPSYYQLAIDASEATNPTTLLLSQAYDPGWKAYEISKEDCWTSLRVCHALPFVFGQEIRSHTMANNWANAWILEGNQQEKTIVLFFIPQLWQYLGFAMLPIPFLLLLFLKRKRS